MNNRLHLDNNYSAQAGAEVAARREELLRRQLEADFQFNLQLVGERDAELARYEAAVAELRQAVNSLTAESSELRVTYIVSHSHSLPVWCRWHWPKGKQRW